MEKCHKVAALYVAILKAAYFIHQQSHWLTKGDNFYGSHLLFQRIYESTLADLDTAAEKMIGVFGPDCLDYDLQVKLLNDVLCKYKHLVGKPVEMSLAIELAFIKFSDEAFKCFESESKMTLGIEDMMAAIASKREEAVYLLKQIKG